MPAGPVCAPWSSPAAIIETSDLPAGACTTFGGSLSSLTCSSSSTNPGHLRDVDAVVVLQDAARPDAGRHRVGAHARLLPFEVLGAADAAILAVHEAAVVEAPHDEDGERPERRAERSRDHVGGGRHLA